MIESHLLHCIYGFRHRVAPHSPSDGMYLDCKMAVADFHAGLEPRIDGQHLGIVAVDGFPNETQTGMLQGLATLPIEYRWSTRFLLQSREESAKAMQTHRRKWEQSSASFVAQFFDREGTGSRSAHSQMMVDDINQAELELAEGFVRYGAFTSVFVIRHPDKSELHSHLRTVRSEMAKAGCAGRIERENASEAFMGSLPGVTKSNVRKPLLPHSAHGQHASFDEPLVGQRPLSVPFDRKGRGTGAHARGSGRRVGLRLQHPRQGRWPHADFRVHGIGQVRAARHAGRAMAAIPRC